MKERTINILHFFLALAIAVAFGLWSARHFRYVPPEPPEVVIQHDTLVVRDTVVTYKPTPVNVYVVDTMWYEVPVYGGRDTVYLPLPREVKEYLDSTYRAVVSGIHPSLDTIDVYQRTVTISKIETVVLEPSRWSWGVQAGVGASKDGLIPYVGIGIQYRLQLRK